MILSSARDHGSIRAAAGMLVRRGGWSAVQLPLRTDATLALPGDLSDLVPEATGGRRILTTTLACGQTGAVEDMAAVARLVARTPGLAVHVDATQALAYLPVERPLLPTATLVLAPHKFGGPRGIGGLFVSQGNGLEPVMPGPQEEGLRGGTEAVVLAVGFARALELAVAERGGDHQDHGASHATRDGAPGGRRCGRPAGRDRRGGNATRGPHHDDRLSRCRSTGARHRGRPCGRVPGDRYGLREWLERAVTRARGGGPGGRGHALGGAVQPRA